LFSLIFKWPRRGQHICDIPGSHSFAAENRAGVS
jgi:hypothetical protein